MGEFNLKKVAVYRAYYGGRWIDKSLIQILKFVDKAYVFSFDKPWYDIEAVRQENGDVIPVERDSMPQQLSWLSRNMDRLMVVDGPAAGISNGPFNTHEMFNYVMEKEPDIDVIVFTMTDYVESDSFGETLQHFIDSNASCMSTRPTRMWRWINFYLNGEDPHRIATMFFRIRNLKVPFDPMGQEKPWLQQQGDFHYFGETFDFGFVLPERDMWWKLAIRREQASRIPDDEPSWEWYNKVWKPWTRESHNVQFGWCDGERDLGSPIELSLSKLPESVRASLWH